MIEAWASLESFYRKGSSHEAKLYFSGHDTRPVDAATASPGERSAPTRHTTRATSSRRFASAGVMPHVAQRITARSRARTSTVERRGHAGYRISQRRRKRVEEIFGWMKTIAGLRKTRFHGVRRNALWAQFCASAYNLLRMAKLPTPTHRACNAPLPHSRLRETAARPPSGVVQHPARRICARDRDHSRRLPAMMRQRCPLCPNRPSPAGR